MRRRWSWALALAVGFGAFPAAAAEPPAAAGAPAPVVVLDPGHGGEDVGLQVPGGPVEKNATLALAQTLEALLARHGVRNVVLTRGRDAFLSLEDRQSLADRKGSAVFIGLHLSDPESASVPELRVFTGRLVQDRTLSRLAARELEDGVRAVPAALAQNPHLRSSERLAKSLVQAWTAMPSRGVPPPRYTPDAPLALLSGIRGAAVLVEIAPRPANRGAGWDTPAQRQRYAERLAAGIEAYLGRR
jgi:N-acetylmuramoyl-L-alanine amidase